jgi:gliding motility-associated-like protein
LEEKDYIKELFSEKLGNQEAPVNPELWSSIASKIAVNSSATAVSSSISSTTKLLITLGISAAVSAVTILVLNTNEEKPKNSRQNQTSELRENQQAISNEKTNSEVQQEQQVSSPNLEKTAEEKTTEHIKDFSNDDEKTQLDLHKTNVIVIKSSENKIETNESAHKKEETKEIITEKVEESRTSNSNSEQNVSYFIDELPNVFTPNNDGNNDYFSIEIKGLSDFSLTILNKENKRVYSTNDIQFSWNGNDFSDQLVAAGSYIYFFSGKDPQGNIISKSNVLKIQY